MKRIWWYTLGFALVGLGFVVVGAAGVLAGLTALAGGTTLAALVNTLLPYVVADLLLGSVAVVFLVGVLVRLVKRGTDAFDSKLAKTAVREAEKRSSLARRLGLVDRF